jgi:hypothetical protein
MRINYWGSFETPTGWGEVRLRVGGVVQHLKQRVEVRRVGLVPVAPTGRHETVRNVRVGAQNQLGHYRTERVSDEDHFLGLVLADGVVVVSKGSADSENEQSGRE